MTKKHKLEWDIEPLGILFAMASDWPDYKLAWALDKRLNWHFKRQPEHYIYAQPQEKNAFLLYQFSSEYTTFSLAKNRALQEGQERSGWLVPELKSFDFLLLIKSDADLDARELKNQLRSCPGIHLVERFDPDELKSKANLIF